MTLSEKAAYLKGLVDGFKLDETKDETTAIKKIVELLSDVSNAVDDFSALSEEMVDSLDEMDEAIADLEDEVYGDYGDFDDDYDDYDFADDEDVYYEVTCPNCGEVINLEEDVLLCGETSCPKCGEELEFDFSELMDDECGCGCGCGHDHEDEEEDDIKF